MKYELVLTGKFKKGLKLAKYCAKVAGMTNEEFIQYLGKNGISIFSFATEGEFVEELANA